ncbi:TPA: DEAD/DEAH box helicase family protein [Streptococcus pneumoniae]
MIQSLFKLENSQSLLDEYEMMIVDECHHISALMFEKKLLLSLEGSIFTV